MDFLMAMFIFTLGLAMLISQMPVLFTPLQTLSTDLQPVAYRTSVILAEDGGIYATGGAITSDWETHKGEQYYYENIRRIGLAMSAPVWCSSEDVVPNNLSREKVDALQEWWNNKTTRSKYPIRDKTGLFVTYNGNPLNYRYNISLKAFNESFITNSTGVPLLQVGNSIPESGCTVEKIERIVAIDNTTNLANYREIGDAQCAKLVVCIWR